MIRAQPNIDKYITDRFGFVGFMTVLYIIIPTDYL